MHNRFPTKVVAINHSDWQNESKYNNDIYKACTGTGTIYLVVENR